MEGFAGVVGDRVIGAGEGREVVAESGEAVDQAAGRATGDRGRENRLRPLSVEDAGPVTWIDAGLRARHKGGAELGGVLDSMVSVPMAIPTAVFIASPPFVRLHH